jgi:two-component system KDP operon response regulator KdpE
MVSVGDEGRVLVIEDDPSLVKVLVPALTARGYAADAAATGTDGLRISASTDPDLVILDLGLPDRDGLDVCAELRRWYQNPIVVLSADGSEDRKVRALDLGADDYVTKPFSTPELLARVRVALRNRKLRVADDLISVGDLTVDVAAHQVAVGGVPVDLTRQELQLLVLLARSPGKVLPYAVLFDQLWGAADSSDRAALRTLVNGVRTKLGRALGSPTVEAERGVGYRLVVPA